MLARHPLVRDVAVVGRAGRAVGRARRRVRRAARRDALTAEPWIATAGTARDLASFKRPRRIVFVTDIPKTASGKILRRLLREGHLHGDDAMSEFLGWSARGAIATIWIDRQAKMNTMTVAMRNEFPGIFRDLDADESVRVIVIRGAGGKAFSAGGDLAEFLTLAPADLELWGDTLTRRERCRKPVIAAIDGFTMGAGLELAVACDFRIATRRSEFAFPEVRLGMIPGSGGTQRALRLIGMTRGKLFMLTGQRIAAERAEAWGLITQAVADDGLDAAVDALAARAGRRARRWRCARSRWC